MRSVELRDALHAAVAQAPHPGVDLDGLIRTEQRRAGRMRAWGATGAAALGVLLVTAVISMPAMLDGSRTSGTAAGGDAGTAPAATAVTRGSPRPCPTESASGEPRPFQSALKSPAPLPENCGEATGRLDRVLAGALRREAAGARFSDALTGKSGVRFIRAHDENTHYFAFTNVTAPAGGGSVTVDVMQRTFVPESEAQARRTAGCQDGTPGLTCTYNAMPDGTLVVGVGYASTIVPGGQYQLWIFRTDSTTVALVAAALDNPAPPDADLNRTVRGTQPPLTLDQLTAIGLDPGLTLYP